MRKKVRRVMQRVVLRPFLFQLCSQQGKLKKVLRMDLPNGLCPRMMDAMEIPNSRKFWRRTRDPRRQKGSKASESPKPK
jgi:hypothetical protein